MSHYERAAAVLLLAVHEATKDHTTASGPFIRKRVESCLYTALAMCLEDAVYLYELIDEARSAAQEHDDAN